MQIKVSIVEDDPVLRECLAILINGTSGFNCVGTDADAESALHHLPAQKPDVVLLDIHLPKLSGIECLRILKPRMPETQFIMLTAYSDDTLVFEALTSGATGYLLKRTAPAKILEAVDEVYRGGSPMTGQIARKVVQSLGRPASASGGEARPENLSIREHEILNYLSKGYRYKEIAARLNISTETVRTHLRRIYEKLQVHSRTEAVVRYLSK
ncbi:MAG: response regulator transcription factor [Verrucomicrobiota bacterium]